MIKRIKLAKALLKFVDVVANDGTVITTEGELEVGKEAYTTDENGEVIPLPTGEYEVNGIVVVVESGVITEMKEPTVEETPVEDTTEVMEEATEETTETTDNANTGDINDENTTNEVEDLKAEIEALKTENEALNAKIKELESELEKAKEPVAETIEEEFKAT